MFTKLRSDKTAVKTKQIAVSISDQAQYGQYFNSKVTHKILIGCEKLSSSKMS